MKHIPTFLVAVGLIVVPSGFAQDTAQTSTTETVKTKTKHHRSKHNHGSTSSTTTTVKDTAK
jgi:hypothetical protein